MALLEAMAVSRPVVATSVGAIPELIEEGRTGFLAPPHDSVALANAMERAMDTSAEVTAGMVERARVRVREMCSFGVVLDKWEELFDHFLDKAAKT